jgi:hypothetical protein
MGMGPLGIQEASFVIVFNSSMSLFIVPRSSCLVPSSSFHVPSCSLLLVPYKMALRTSRHMRQGGQIVPWDEAADKSLCEIGLRKNRYVGQCCGQIVTWQVCRQISTWDSVADTSLHETVLQTHRYMIKAFGLVHTWNSVADKPLHETGLRTNRYMRRGCGQTVAWNSVAEKSLCETRLLTNRHMRHVRGQIVTWDEAVDTSLPCARVCVHVFVFLSAFGFVNTQGRRGCIMSIWNLFKPKSFQDGSNRGLQSRGVLEQLWVSW